MSLSRSGQGIRNTEQVPLSCAASSREPRGWMAHGPSPCLCVHHWTKRFKSTPQKVTLGAVLLMEVLTCVELSWYPQFSSVQSLSHVRLCDPMNFSMPGLLVHHQLPEFTQTHVHRVSDAIQPSHPLSSPSPPAPNPSQYPSLFQ